MMMMMIMMMGVGGGEGTREERLRPSAWEATAKAATKPGSFCFKYRNTKLPWELGCLSWSSSNSSTPSKETEPKQRLAM